MFDLYAHSHALYFALQPTLLTTPLIHVSPRNREPRLSVHALSGQAAFSRGYPRKPCLDVLPEDVIIEVLALLEVVDIIRMRGVSKLYFYLSHHGALWKRKLRQTRLPLHPLPHTYRHSLDHLTGLEAERILIRTASLHRNWNSRTPKPLHEWTFDAHHRILDMTLLPGGQFLIASAADKSFTRFSLVIYAMDYLGTARPIAKTDTEMRAYDIRAKYMTIGGEQGITISYLRREYLSKRHRERMHKGLLPDTNEYSTYHQIEPERPLRYESVTLHATLTALQCLLDIPHDTHSEAFVEEARKHPPPFRLLSLASSRSMLSSPPLEELAGGPYVAVAKQPNDVLFINLANGGRSVLTCAPGLNVAPEALSIKAIRLVKETSQVFIVRAWTVRPGNPRFRAYHTFELFAALRVGAGMRAAPVMRSADDVVGLTDAVQVTHVFISDSATPPRDDRSVLASLPRRARPPTISVFFRSTALRSLRWVKFFPSREERGAPWRYNLAHNHIAAHECEGDDVLHVLPATTHPLVYFTPFDETGDAPRVSAVSPVYDKYARHVRVVDGTLAIPEEFADERDRVGRFSGALRSLDAHVSRLAWDEHIGRLVLASREGYEVKVYDFAQAPRQNLKRERCPLPLVGIPDPDNVRNSGWVHKQQTQKPPAPDFMEI